MNKEPTPTKGSMPVSDRAISSFVGTFSKQVESGFEKYGTSLEAANGRSAFNDAMQETVDLVQYLTQQQIEKEILIAYLRRARHVSGYVNVSDEMKDVVEQLISNERDLTDERYDEILNYFTSKT